MRRQNNWIVKVSITDFKDMEPRIFSLDKKESAEKFKQWLIEGFNEMKKRGEYSGDIVIDIMKKQKKQKVDGIIHKF